jgi:hypothetical protein
MDFDQCEVEILGTDPQESFLYFKALSKNEVIDYKPEGRENENEKLFIVHVNGHNAAAVKWSEKDLFWKLFEYVNKVRSAVDNDPEEYGDLDEGYQGVYHYTPPLLSIPSIDYLDKEECVRDVRSIIYSTRKALDELESFVNKVDPNK